MQLFLLPQSWIFLSLAFRAEASTSIKTIGIIGGGVSGLGAANRLSQSSNHKVIVLERGSEPVPLQHQIYNNGNTHDMDMIYIPNLNWKGYGIETRWKNLLQQHNVELLPVDEFGPGGLYSEPHFMNVHELEEFEDSFLLKQSLSGTSVLYEQLCRFINQFQHFYDQHIYNGVSKCLEHGIAFRNESFAEWYERNDYEEVGKFSSRLLALYGNIPVANGPACQVLMMLSNKMPSILGPLLPTIFQNFVTHGTEPMNLHPKLPEIARLWLAGMHLEGKSTFMYSFKHGYAKFFQNIIRNNQIDYRTNVQVSHIDYHKQGKVVYTNSGSQYFFDELVVATRPEQALTFLPKTHPMSSLFQEAADYIEEKDRKYGVYAVGIIAVDVAEKDHPSVGNYSMSRLARMNFTQYVLNLPDYLDLVSVDNVKNDTVNVMRIVKQFANSNMITVVWQCPYEMVKTKSELNSLNNILTHLGYTNIKIVHMQHYPFTPTYLSLHSICKGWYEQAEKAQGVEKIYFVGEVFSGHGVPTTWLHSADYVQNVFKLEDATPLHFEWGLSMDKLSNKNKLSKMNQIAPIEGGLENMGMEMFMTLLNHPVDAVNMGIDPLLVINWTKEFGVIPFMFIWFLLSVCLCLRLCEYLLERCNTNGTTGSIRRDKIRNVSIYFVELIVSTGLLFVAYSGTWELLTFHFPEQMLTTINSVVVCTVCMNGLYLCELFYHDNMRLSLKVHHYACILMLQLMTMLYIQERQLVVLRMGLYNAIFAMTEQNVFITMILHRMFPKVLHCSPSIMSISAYIYIFSRLAIGIICLVAWCEFLSIPSSSPQLVGMHSIMQVVYPLLLVIQGSMQLICFQSLLGLAKQYQLHARQQQRIAKDL